MRGPGTRVVNEQIEARTFEGRKVEIKTIEWNDTDLISVDVSVELEGQWALLTGDSSLDEYPSDEVLRELIEDLIENPKKYEDWM